MKKKSDRDLIILIILIPVLLWGAFFISSRLEGNLPAYSVANKSSMGLSVFFEALEELDLPVSRIQEPVYVQDTGSVQLVAQHPDFDINDEDVMDWVADGGILVYLTTFDLQPPIYGVTPEISGSLRIYDYGAGRIIAAEASGLTNGSLGKDTSKAYDLLSEIEILSAGHIYFNEYYMYSGLTKESLWSRTPAGIKFILYQLLIILAAFFYLRGKRFGKALPLYEEEERSENEYLYSVAALYSHAGCYDLILESYYNHFLSLLKYTRGNWPEYWTKENLPHGDIAREVYGFMQQPPMKINRKKYLLMISKIEQLSAIIRKRSDVYWKTKPDPMLKS